MVKIKSENRIKAFDIYKEHKGKIKPKEIAMKLNINPANVRTWKSLDKWEDKLGLKKSKRGAPKGNKNSIGNKGGAPKENQNSRKHGLYSKYMPKEVYNIFSNIDTMDNIEILEDSIKLKYANILNIQKQMQGGRGLASLVKAEALATGELRGMIKLYEDLVHKNWDLDIEEQQAKIEVLKSKVIQKEEKREDKLDQYITALEDKVKNNPLSDMSTEELKEYMKDLKEISKNSSNGLYIEVDYGEDEEIEECRA